MSRTTLGQKLLENILLMALQLSALSRPFHRSAEFSGGGGVFFGGGCRGESSLLKKSRAFLEAQSVKTLPTMSETRLRSQGQKDPKEEGMATH